MDWEGAGGFINDSIAEEPQAIVNSVSVSGDDKNKSLVAVSVSQVVKLTRPNEGLILHGRKVYQVNLVALVYEILDITSLKIHLLVDDYTGGGPLEVSHITGDIGNDDSMFMDGEQRSDANIDEPKSLAHLKVGDYIRCIGMVKFTQNKANLVVYNMRIVEDPNEVTTHTLEVIRDSMYFERLQSGAGPVSVKEERSGNVATSYQQNQQKAKEQNEFGRLSTRDKHVLKYLRDKADSAGLQESSIFENLKAFSKADIKASLDTLAAEGLCWQGDQEDHWCVTE